MDTLIPFPNRIAPAGSDAARIAYDTLAPVYDALTAGVDDEARLDVVEELAHRHGAGGRRVLDVACGTGRSFLPLLGRGYAVVACDSSPAMVRRAANKAPQVPMLVADMRALPQLGRYDLVTCLGGAFNCLLHHDELRAALRGIVRSLEPDGLAIFDAHTLALTRSCFAGDWVADRGEWFIAWHGTASPEIGPGAVVEARVDAFRRRPAAWERTSARLKQRHWPVAEIARQARASGLTVLDVVDDPGSRALFVARADA
ncbi:class I SAM-dependent DNA methyltransferase [Solirubrobacter soli]|uniref:class I SAM-dependent DNA methyltransferase n=1 Tax=Solirubrobacter soli TaxID=363832 RepID=UPI000416A72F|nr:class I SAM-dependent methyltransferase [Solirubrobacter soli]